MFHKILFLIIIRATKINLHTDNLIIETVIALMYLCHTVTPKNAGCL